MLTNGGWLAPVRPYRTLRRPPALAAALVATEAAVLAVAEATAVLGLVTALAAGDAACGPPQAPSTPARPALPASTMQVRRRPRRVSWAECFMGPACGSVPRLSSGKANILG